MKLFHARIKDFRSFVGEHDFDVSPGVNYFVGPNNCGKSNFIAAINLALDPDLGYEPSRDRPAQNSGTGAPPKTRIALTFKVGSSQVEKTLLTRAREYENAVQSARGSAAPAATFADDGEVRLVVAFAGQGARQTSFQAKGTGAASLASDAPELIRLYEQFKKALRLVVLHSGEDLAQVLRGRFREILNFVIRDHLKDEVEAAELARLTYVKALQDQLLHPLQQTVQDLVGGYFPEIDLAELVPDIPALTETLSSVDVRLHDAALTQLAGKGTGVRGAVLVAMLRYLAEQSKRSLVIAVEEPEAFLHPAAQESVMSSLEQLAAQSGVTLLVATHSPYVISQSADARINALHKDALGATRVRCSVAADEDTSVALGPLFRDHGFARIIRHATSIPAGTRGIVITEGYTDGEFLRIGCAAAGTPELLEHLMFVPGNKASQAVVEALVMRSVTDLPIVAVFDSDEPGKAAMKQLTTLNWNTKKDVLSLQSYPDRCGRLQQTEIEDLLPTSVIEQVTALAGGEDVSISGKTRCGDHWHYQPNADWKDAALDHLESVISAADAGGLVWLAEEINRRIAAIEKGSADKASA